MTDENWMNDSTLSDIAPEKIHFLAELFTQGANVSQKDMFAFLMKTAKLSKEKNISFQKDEIQRIYAVLKKSASEYELQKLEKVSSYFQ